MLHVRLVIYITFSQSPKTLFSLAAENPVHLRVLPEILLRVVGYLRPAKPDGHSRHNLFALGGQLRHIYHIPDITGKEQHVRLFPVDIPQDFPGSVINRELNQLHLIPDGAGGSPEAVDC